jgi:hypothetical protein
MSDEKTVEIDLDMLDEALDDLSADIEGIVEAVDAARETLQTIRKGLVS